MYGRYSLPDNLPRLRTYADALDRYNNTVPLRTGDDKGLVPLGSNRRYKRSQMIKGTDRFGVDYIICRYWDHNVITFFANGTTKLDVGGWHTPTTLMFLQGVMGQSKFKRYKGKIYFMRGEAGFYLDPVNGLQLNSDGSPHEPTQEVTKILNRPKWRAMTKRVKPLTDYVVDMLKVSEPKTASEMVDEFKVLMRTYGEDYWRPMAPNLGMPNSRVPYLTISASEIKYNRGKIMQVRTEYMSRVMQAVETGDPEQMYPLMFVLTASATEQRWTGNGYVSECSPARAKKYLHELLKFEFRDELFDDVPQPLGTLVTDGNAKYFTKPRAGF
jgi:hypothetical protein